MVYKADNRYIVDLGGSRRRAGGRRQEFSPTAVSVELVLQKVALRDPSRVQTNTTVVRPGFHSLSRALFSPLLHASAHQPDDHVISLHPPAPPTRRIINQSKFLVHPTIYRTHPSKSQQSVLLPAHSERYPFTEEHQQALGYLTANLHQQRCSSNNKYSVSSLRHFQCGSREILKFLHFFFITSLPASMSGTAQLYSSTTATGETAQHSAQSPI